MEFTKDISFSNILRANKKTGITYSGDLFKKQSEFVAIVYGFGENWEHTTEQEMIKTENGFTVDVDIKSNFDTFNFCFRNGNYEWDNNQSFNYISAIQPAIVEETVSSTDTLEEIEENEFDADLIIEILDNILEENFSQVQNISSELNDKQQILDEILSKNETSVQSPVLMEEFNMDELIENILNPVINCEIKQDNFEDTFTFSETDSKASEDNTNTALVPTPEDTFLVSPRKLRKFYLIGKKIKLAFYKLFVGIPKLLSGNLGENKN